MDVVKKFEQSFKSPARLIIEALAGKEAAWLGLELLPSAGTYLSVVLGAWKPPPPPATRFDIQILKSLELSLDLLLLCFSLYFCAEIIEKLATIVYFDGNGDR